MTRYHPDGSVYAEFRPMQYCYACFTWKSAGSFAASRIKKRDYECRLCNNLRKARERLLARAYRRVTA